MSDIMRRARACLRELGCSCVVINADSVRHSDLKGIAPLMGWLEEDPAALENACVADKVVGKAAALIMVFAGVSEVYAELISEPAIRCFEKNGVSYSYGKSVPFISNRTKTGLCPMEQLCLEIDSPKQGYEALKGKMLRMREEAKSLTKGSE